MKYNFPVGKSIMYSLFQLSRVFSVCGGVNRESPSQNADLSEKESVDISLCAYTSTDAISYLVLSLTNSKETPTFFLNYLDQFIYCDLPHYQQQFLIDKYV